MRLVLFLAALALLKWEVPSHTPSNCDLSSSEMAQLQLTASQATDPQPAYKPVFPKDRFDGCGVWALSVGAEGKVRSARLVRSTAGKDYESMARQLAMNFTFRPSNRAWDGLMRFYLTDPRSKGAPDR